MGESNGRYEGEIWNADNMNKYVEDEVKKNSSETIEEGK